MASICSRSSVRSGGSATNPHSCRAPIERSAKGSVQWLTSAGRSIQRGSLMLRPADSANVTIAEHVLARDHQPISNWALEFGDALELAAALLWAGGDELRAGRRGCVGK